MKKLILTSLAVGSCLALASNSQAQGTIDFSSSSSPTPCIVSNTISGATSKITSAQYTFALYLSPVAQGTNALSTSLTPAYQATGAGFPGSISGQISIALPTGYTTGSTYLFEIGGWTTTGGSSYASALASGLSGLAIGVSSIGEVTLGGGNILPGNIFGTSGGTVASPVLLTPVPEPSTMVLGGLGVAALAFFRRRK